MRMSKPRGSLMTHFGTFGELSTIESGPISPQKIMFVVFANLVRCLGSDRFLLVLGATNKNKWRSRY
jgi:hypothetical protein